ncbi:hypothetical protein P154DRAFT_521984 [Amniculicola lignicola CBS 123094]|uniref:Ubiquitin 3 binding protein But2 C-terminal domain-containing protein n=1 Tax=Amniculicola lignicola CBS 123094 TaxID=1392246 RepID=A0A6A5WJU5_9PLEO|nr:hypothetical protein P154DRAFT_521984 [Amniculicola lignicola CBS 123094]
MLLSLLLSSCLVARLTCALPASTSSSSPLLPSSLSPPSSRSSLEPRSCAVEYPTWNSYISKEHPHEVSFNTYLTIAWKDPGYYIYESLIQFSNIPAKARVCQLELFFPTGYAEMFGLSGGTNRLFIYRVPAPLPRRFDWNTAPQPAYLFGTTPKLPMSEIMQQELGFIINSAPCEPTMAFRIAISSDAAKGGVDFFKDTDFPTAGFRLTHDCL